MIRAPLIMIKGCVDARINRSTLLIQMGRYADALGDCGHVLQLDAQNVPAYLNCSLAYSGMGKTREALNYLNDAVRIDPQNAIIYYNRGNIHVAMEHYQDAMQDYPPHKASMLRPMHEQV